MLKLSLSRFFDQNPMSQLAVVATRNGVAEKLTMFTGTARRHTIEVAPRTHLDPVVDVVK